MNFRPRNPWTHEEIQEFLPKLESELAQKESENPNIKPLPPMTLDECKTYLFRFIGLASERPLSGDEAFFLGQLISVFQSSVRAETLEYKGRFFVLTEDDVNQMIGQQ